MRVQTTATGSIAAVLSIRRFLFYFVTKWSLGKNDDGFLDKIRKDLIKWEKKVGKKRDIANGESAAKNGTPTNNGTPTTTKRRDTQTETADGVTATTENSTATAKDSTPAKKTTAKTKKPTAPIEAATANKTKEAATFTKPTATKEAATHKKPTAMKEAATHTKPTAMAIGTASNPTATASNPTATASNPTATAQNENGDSIKVKRPRVAYQPPIDPPAAGPSRQIQPPLYQYRKLRDLDNESGEDEVVSMKNPTSGSEKGYPTPPPTKRMKLDHVPSRQNNYRRPPMPTGVLFSIPCNRCVRRGKPCEKDAQSASCTLCYRLKNRCDYGKRQRQTPKPNFRGKGKGKGRAKDEDESESDESMTEHESRRRKRTAKQIKSSKHIVETDDDDDMASEPFPSGYDTSRVPPPSRSPSPQIRPTRAAAKKTRKAVAAMLAVDMESKKEARQAPEEVDGNIITFYII